MVVRFFIENVFISTVIVVDLISTDSKECFSKSFSLDVLNRHLIDLLL